VSGIAGIFNFDGSPVRPEVLHTLTNYLTFRGPDAQRTWCAGSVGFGHTLLRTATDTANDEQPASLDGRFWITADARIDARAELIEKLNSKGSVVSLADADHQLILHAYRAWDSACVEHLLGDFSFAIWDGARRRLFCARDHFGVKPFYYARVGGILVFSNTLNCLRLHPGVSAKLNDRAIADFLLFDANQDMATTTFADIQRLPPAHTLECHDDTVSVRRYWTLPAPAEIKYKRSEEYVEHFNDVLDLAVGDRLRAETVGVWMSGGLDSPTVAASAQRLFVRAGKTGALHAYTEVFDRLIPHQERHFAGLAAKALGIPIHYKISDGLKLYDVFDDPSFNWPEPAHTPWAASTLDQLREISTQSHVVLTGHGADPALSSSLSSHFRNLIRKLRFGRALGDMASFLSAEGRFSRLYLRTRWRLFFKGKEENPWFPPWLNDDLEKRLGLRERWSQIEAAKAPVEAVRPGSYELTASTNWVMLFESYDPGNTRVPVEARYPFFDVRLLNFLLALPALPWCSDKELLRRGTRGSLPEEVRLRRKSPLSTDPLVILLQHPGSGWVDGFAPAKELVSWVDLSRVPKVYGESASWKAWIHLRPLSLNLWLQRYQSVGYKLSVEDRLNG
jgi:asparagine synthase (glutamine-hydrolysing)